MLDSAEPDSDEEAEEGAELVREIERISGATSPTRAQVQDNVVRLPSRQPTARANTAKAVVPPVQQKAMAAQPAPEAAKASGRLFTPLAKLSPAPGSRASRFDAWALRLTVCMTQAVLPLLALSAFLLAMLSGAAIVGLGVYAALTTALRGAGIGG